MRTPVEQLSGHHRPSGLLQRLLAACCLATLALLHVSCSGPGVPANDQAPKQASHVLTPVEAAQLAAQLANDECDRLYRKHPFTSDQYPAILKGDQYSWGGLNPAGKAGYSALVVLGADGSQPKVEVYFSTDANIPSSTEPPSKRP